MFFEAHSVHSTRIYSGDNVHVWNAERHSHGIIVLDYHFYIRALCFRLNSGNFEIVVSPDANVIFNACIDFNGDNGIFFKELFYGIPNWNHEYTMINFKKAIGLYSLKYGINDELVDFLSSYGSIKKISFSEAAEYMSKNYDLSMTFFKNEMGKKEEVISLTDEEKFECCGFSVSYSAGGILSKEEAIEAINAVSERLGVLSSKLCYGNLEIKNGFNGDQSGDYDASLDEIRVSNDTAALISTILHELGHRMYEKFLNAKDKKKIKSLYDNARGMSNKPVPGDEITYNGVDYVVLQPSSFFPRKLHIEKKLDGKKYFLSRTGYARIEKINGRSCDNLKLPSDYAGSDVYEFFSECFMFYFANRNSSILDARLRSEFDEILGGY